MVKPYVIIEKDDNYQIRLFENYNPRDLFWHRDREDRKVTLLEGNLSIQFEDEIPQAMMLGQEFKIPAMTYHRVIADGEKFVVKVTFI